MEKVLIITGKLYADPTGGGGTMVKELVDLLKNRCLLDLCFLRTPNGDLIIEGVHHLWFYPIKQRISNKFERRILNKEHNLALWQTVIEKYDKIIVIHASKVFGLEQFTPNQRAKVILFPMFLGTDYQRAGENVIQEYIYEEKKVLALLPSIIVPTNQAKSTLIDDYQVPQTSIKVIPRQINPIFFGIHDRLMHAPIRFINVSSIRKQKNLERSLQIIKYLNVQGSSAHLEIIGAIEDTHELKKLHEDIRINQLGDHVTLSGPATAKEIATKMSHKDFNLTSSRWETFGRTVFEGMAAGLPTFYPTEVTVIKEIGSSSALIPYSSNEDLFRSLTNIINSGLYDDLSKCAFDFSKRFHCFNISSQILHQVFRYKPLLFVFGTRPELMKILPVISRLRNKGVAFQICNTNQHPEIIEEVIAELGVQIDITLSFDNKGKERITKEKALLHEFEKSINLDFFSAVVVQGDTLSTYIGARFAHDHDVPIVYIEAGLRTFDLGNPDPEEFYRTKISEWATIMFAPTEKERVNLILEGKNSNDVFVVGNTIIDFLTEHVSSDEDTNNVIVTIHRNENLVHIDTIFKGIIRIARNHPDLNFFYVTHLNPRVVEASNVLKEIENITYCQPMTPLKFYGLLGRSRYLITDSGGLQEEGTFLNKKVLVVRHASERRYFAPHVVLCEPNEKDMQKSFEQLILAETNCDITQVYGNGNAADQITDIIERRVLWNK